MKQTMIHGGDIAAASRVYGIAAEQWIDLSTGINPRAYPVPPIPAKAFAGLPYPDAQLQQAAAAYYGCQDVLPIAGSQSLIQALPSLLPPLPLLVPQTGYQEYRWHWLQHGGRVENYPAWSATEASQVITQRLTENPARHVLLIQPNNPTGLCFSVDQLLQWSACLQQRGYLIVDEAFMDVQNSGSLLARALPDNVIVLRSFGKFFGLAGLRLGFVFAEQAMLQTMQRHLGLWAVNGVAQWVAIQALQDKQWQQQARLAIAQDSAFTRAVTEALLPDTRRAVHTGLFSSYVMDKQAALAVYQQFARQAVLLRYLELDGHEALIRIGRLQQGSEQAMRLQQRCSAML